MSPSTAANQARTQVALLMCGSFNPVTRMHLKMMRIGENFFTSNSESKVIKGIISPVNDLYHVKRRNLVKSFHRIKMINLALEEEKLNWVECNTWESEQKEWQTTINVLNHHSQQINQENGCKVQLWMVTGGDMIESMAVPGLWKDEDLEAIAGNFKLLIIPRIGSDAGSFVKSHHILSRYQKNIVVVDTVQPNADSSTKARESIKKGGNPVHLLHNSVIQYIEENKLYIDG